MCVFVACLLLHVVDDHGEDVVAEQAQLTMWPGLDEYLLDSVFRVADAKLLRRLVDSLRTPDHTTPYRAFSIYNK